jgi:hypothetical protein
MVRPRKRAKLLRVRTGRRHEWPLEERWYECLAYPFRALIPLLALAAVLAAATALSAMLPRMERPHPGEAEYWFLTWSWAAVVLVLLGAAVDFLACVLTYAAGGETAGILWPVRDPRFALQSVGTWLVCFLAGPVVPAAAALLYARYWGELALVDWLIVGELLVLAVAYWLLALVAVHGRNRLRDANPLRIAELFPRFGGGVLLASAFASGLFLVHLRLAFLCLEELQRGSGFGLLGLAGCWLSLLFLSTFLFRLLGLWSYWSRLPHKSSDSQNLS